MRVIAILLILLGSCQMIGEATEETTQSAFVVFIYWLLGPLIAILSWPVGKWMGQETSSYLTGTEEGPRVETGDAIINTPDTSMKLIIIGLVIYAAVQLGIWKLLKVKMNTWLAAKFKELDDEWVKNEYEPWKKSVEARLNARQ